MQGVEESQPVSSEEEEDDFCPLCMEEIEVDDKYFKPCPCGYQLCRFCWNHIKNDLNGLCPACRRPYSDDAIEFKPVPPEELIRIKNAKKKRERDRKEQEQSAKKQLSNVRVVQKNLVYVLGLPVKLATEETLKSLDFFGQYGRISKVVVNRRNPAVGPSTHSSSPATSNTGIYITFQRKEDAAKAIEALDGTNFEGKIIRATFGTTKYCSYFLKGQNCANVGCQFLHENGEDAEAYLKEEARLYHQRHEKSKHTAFQPRPTETLTESTGITSSAAAPWAKPAPGTRNTSTSDFYDAVDHSSDFDPETNSFTPKPSTPTPAVVAPLNDETHYPSLESSAHIVPESSSSFPNNATASNNASKRKQRQLAAAQAAAQSVPRVPDHLILGSSALDPDYVPDISHPHALPPFPYTSPYAAGYTLRPRYTGLFDPFSGQSKLSSVLIANTRVVGPTPTTAATTAAVPSPSSEPVIVSAKSRYERLFDAPEQKGQGQTGEEARWNTPMQQQQQQQQQQSVSGAAGGPLFQQEQMQQQYKLQQQYQQQMQQQMAYGTRPFGGQSGGIRGVLSGQTASKYTKQHQHYETVTGNATTPPPPGFAPHSLYIPDQPNDESSSTLRIPKKVGSMVIPIPDPSVELVVQDLRNVELVDQSPSLRSGAGSTDSLNEAKTRPHRVLKIVSASSLSPSEPLPPPPSPPSETQSLLNPAQSQKKPRDSNPSASSVSTLPPVEQVQVAPILSRKTKKKKPPRVIPAVVKKEKVVDTSIPVDPPIADIATENAAPPTPSISTPIPNQDPSPSSPKTTSLSQKLIETDAKSITMDSEEIRLVFEKVLEKSNFLVSQLHELDFDGHLSLRISQLPDCSQVASTFTAIRRLFDPICALAKCPDLGRLVSTPGHPQSSISKTVIDSIAATLYSVHKTVVMIRVGLESKIEYIRTHHGRKKIKKLVGEWNRCLEEAMAIENSSMEGLNACYEGGAGLVTENESDQSHSLVSDADDALQDDIIVQPTTTITTADSSLTPAIASPAPFSPLSVEQYLEELLTAVHDFVYVPQLHESAASSSSELDLSMLEDESRRRPWIALAAATGLDPKNFDITHQITLVRALQNHFPSPRDLIALIVENPTDPRLRFESLININPDTATFKPVVASITAKKSKSEMEARVSELQQQLLKHRTLERELEAKLNSIKKRNDVWRGEVLEILGLRAILTTESGDLLDDDVDGDWVDE